MAQQNKNLAAEVEALIFQSKSLSSADKQALLSKLTGLTDDQLLQMKAVFEDENEKYTENDKRKAEDLKQLYQAILNVPRG